MGEAQPTPAGLEAAHEVLKMFPDRYADSNRENLVVALAALHDRIGADRFQLRFGLRPPRNSFEQATLDHAAGQLNDDQLKQTFEEYIMRAVDLDMLQTFYGALEKQVVAYGCLVAEAVRQTQLVSSGVVSGWNEEAVQNFADKLVERFPLSSDELETVNDFAQEARLMRNLGLVRMSGREWPTVGMAVSVAHQQLELHLQRRPDGRIRMGCLPRISQAIRSGDLPMAADLLTVHQQEFSASRTLLRDRSHQSTAQRIAIQQLSIQVDRCDLTAAIGNISSQPADSAKPDVRSDLSRKKHCIDRWSDLALGYDGKMMLFIFAGSSPRRPRDNLQRNPH